MIFVHPLQLSPVMPLRDAALQRRYRVDRQTMDGFFDDLFDTAWDAIAGLSEAVSDALTSVIDTVKQLGETIALVVRAAVGDVAWSEVFDSLGVVFQHVGNIMVVINPTRMFTNVLMESRLTGHAFRELDKFSGGLITNVTNVSDVVYRAMRGDPISKVEIIKDILTIITIAMLVFGGPVGIGIYLGTLVGREVCKHQTHAIQACTAAFQILGAAFGGWAGAADATFAQMLENASVEYLERVGIDQASIQIIEACKSGHWSGGHECEIIGQIAADYIKMEMSDTSMTWEQFVVAEIARIGAQELMLQWFPPEEPIGRALRAWRIQYRDELQYVESTPQRSAGGALLLLAGGAAMLLLGAGS